LATNKKRFKLFDMNRDGKGVVEENTKPTLAFFFKSLLRKFPQLLRLNILMLFQILPLIFIVIVFLAGDKTPSATSTTYAPLLGIDQVISSPNVSQSLDMASIQMGLPVFSPIITCTIIVLALFLLITWGWQNVGATYVLRGLVRGDAVFVFTDYFYAIKRNLKQGFFMGIVDLLLSAVLVIDFIYFYQRTGQFGMDFMYFVIFALAIIYFLMRFYVYLLLITFDMKNFKIIKNSLIFSILGIKRNIMAFIGIAIVIVLHALLIWFLISTPLGFAMILPFVYLLALTAFMSAYAAYPIIDKYLIEPYAADQDDEEFVYLKPADDASGDTSAK
jgi:uncharacterized membrane protein YesL